MSVKKSDSERLKQLREDFKKLPKPQPKPDDYLPFAWLSNPHNGAGGCSPSEGLKPRRIITNRYGKHGEA